jgi:alpha-galactosidase
VRLTDRPYELARRLFAQRARVAHCLLGDYYPLTSYSLENDAWLAWQFDRPDLGEGLVQAFRREESPFESGRFRLHGLDLDARYIVTDFDSDRSREISGRELTEAGQPITVTQRPGAAALMYEMVR